MFSEIRRMAMEKIGLTEEKFNSPSFQKSMAYYMENQKNKLIEREHLSPEEAEKRVCKENRVVADAMGPLANITNGIKIWWNENHVKEIEQTLKYIDTSLITIRDDDNIKFEKIKRIVENREIKKSELKATKKRLKNLTIITKKGKEDEKQKNQIFEEITTEYIKTGRTISDIFEQYKKEGKIKNLDFEDVLIGFEKNLKKEIGAGFSEEDVTKIIDNEKKCRLFELTLGEYENVTAGIINKNEEFEKEQKDEISAERERLYEERNKLNKQRDILLKKKNLTPNEKRNSVQIGEKNTIVRNNIQRVPKSMELAKQEKDTVKKDISEIVKIKRELGISLSEASKKYFEENPEKLKLYSESEQLVLTGKNMDEVNRNNIVFKRRMKNYERNSNTIDKYKFKMRELSEMRDSLKGNPDKAKELAKIERKIKLNGKKMRTLLRIKVKKEHKMEGKTVKDILLERRVKADQEMMFAEFMETGKSVYEVYMAHYGKENGGNGQTYEDVFEKIMEEAKKYLHSDEITRLVDSENKIYERYQKQENSKQQSNNEMGSKKIDDATNEKKDSNRVNSWNVRSLIIKRAGMYINPEYLQELENENINQTQEEHDNDIDKIVEGTTQGEKSLENQSQTANKAGIEIGKIEVKPKKKIKTIGFFKKLFTKNGVTKSSMKEEMNTITALAQEIGNLEKNDGQDENENSKKCKAIDDALVQ